jgi:preprotein translocase subunit SecG
MGKTFDDTVQKTVKEAAKGAVTFGKVMSDIKAISATIFFIIFLIITIVLLTRPNKKYIKVSGKVSKITNTPLCDKQTRQISTQNTDYDKNVTTSTTSQTFYDCHFNITYTPIGKDTIVKKESFNFNTPLTEGQSLDVYYLENDPTDISINSEPLNCWVYGSMFIW